MRRSHVVLPLDRSALQAEPAPLLGGRLSAVRRPPAALRASRRACFSTWAAGPAISASGWRRQLGAEVVVADVTPEMLRRVSPDPSISVRLTAAEALPFPDGHFDGLLCSDAFHHFRDQDAAARGDGPGGQARRRRARLRVPPDRGGQVPRLRRSGCSANRARSWSPTSCRGSSRAGTASRGRSPTEGVITYNFVGCNVGVDAQVSVPDRSPSDEASSGQVLGPQDVVDQPVGPNQTASAIRQAPGKGRPPAARSSASTIST